MSPRGGPASGIADIRDTELAPARMDQRIVPPTRQEIIRAIAVTLDIAGEEAARDLAEQMKRQGWVQ